MQPFKLAVNMAGAVSAGAYTAGVLDFLTEALDEWYNAKASALPHHVSIEAFSGASAGGMCAAISSVILQDKFDHIDDASSVGTNNKLYEAWVNAIDIGELLKTDDLKSGSISSLLDSTIIASIADRALSPGVPQTRKYVSPQLTLFLTVTNLRGIPYALFEGQTLTPDEYVTYHADRLRFELVDPGQSPKSPDARPLTRGANDAMWDVLRTAAMATGAFPAFLASRALDRNQSEYATPLWDPLCQPSASTVAPEFPKGQQDPWTTVNVDGGVTNNSPFALAHDYLATLDPRPAHCAIECDALRADRAVVTVAPFPGNSEWNKSYDVKRQSTLFSVLSNLLSTLLSQSRFFGESLAIVTSGPSFSRFFIAPSDDSRKGEPPLQCGLLGAFGGFFERDFRAHDFALGRRNCQRFLERSFLLPEGNPLFADAPKDLRDKFIRKAPEGAEGVAERWLPIIPLVGSAAKTVPTPDLGQIESKSLDDIIDLIAQRAKALLPLMLKPLVSGVLRFLIRWGTTILISVRGKYEIRQYLLKALQPFVVEKKSTPAQASTPPHAQKASPQA